MTRQSERIVLAEEHVAQLRAWIAREVKGGRRACGLSQGAVATAAGISRAQYGRLERGELRSIGVEQASRVFSALGQRLALSAWPDADPVRDAGSQRLLGRFRGLVPGAARVRTEVGLPIPGDRRAWDVTLDLRGRRAGCELETKLRDIQALERKLALKVRDGAVDVLILVLADTPANRAVLARHREALRGLLPLDSAQILAAFRRGELPGANGILLV